MIAYLEGQVLFVGRGMIVVKTTEGVGYEVRVTQPVCSKYRPPNQIALYTHTHVREDELTLYGILNTDEKECFELLIKTTGVGPKLGLSVLSVLSIHLLTDAVLQNNTAVFSKVPGIGRKTAAKLCLDLRDKLKTNPLSKEAENGISFSTETEGLVDQELDLTSALKNMGFQEREIHSVLYQAGGMDQPFEVRLKKALSLLAPLR